MSIGIGKMFFEFLFLIYSSFLISSPLGVPLIAWELLLPLESYTRVEIDEPNVNIFIFILIIHQM